MGTSVLTNGLMTMVNAAAPTANYDYVTAPYLRRASGTPGEVRMLTYFARPFPLGTTITSAKLVLYSIASAQAGTVSFDVKRISTAVSFSKVTWTSRPTLYYAGAASVSKTGPITSGTVWEADVTTMMQSVALGDPWYGFEISSTTITPSLTFYDTTNAAVQYRPRLEVTWSDAPSKPRSLSPSGSRAISVAKPTLRCDYVDVSGDTAMQSIQVQTNSTAVFTAPAFDSGTVATSTPELDLNTTAFPAMTDGQTVYWRVRVQDMAGLWSEWSDPVDFKRDIKGTLTLTNPSSGTPIVEESTPPISWTFTGETQSSYQLTVTRTYQGQATLWTTGKKTGNTTTVTLPTGVLTSPDASYEATLRVWDAKQRESIAGDPAYAEVVRAFTYVPSATVSATTSPTAASVYPFPRVIVGWQRATDPDSFTILRNRQVIASGLLPAAVRVSGSTFSWVDTGPSPQTTLVYEVQAVVNGKASASNPTVTTTMRSQGVWLADYDRTNEVVIVGTGGKPAYDITYGEASEVVEVVGGTEIVLVTQSMRGAQGTVSGDLHSNLFGLTTTAQQWRDKLLNIKAKPGRRCWLTLGDRTIQCVIRNVSISPRPSATLSFSVSFEFYQVGALDYVPTL